MIPDRHRLLSLLRALHGEIRDAVVARAETDEDALAAVADDTAAGDTIFAIDRVSEEQLTEFFEREIAPSWPLVLVAEGLPDTGAGEGKLVLPRGMSEHDAIIRVLMDPIDGTRGLMYQKRSAWILTGVAPNLGPATRLRDIELALQTELPLVKQHLADQLWAFRGEGYVGVRTNWRTDEMVPLRLRPSAASTLDQGFATIDSFFPGMRRELAGIDEDLHAALFGPVRRGKAFTFEDQYICSGGQFYELMAGHDRFVADLRPLVEPLLAKRGLALGLCCHPYDVCTALIAEQAGVVLTDGQGHPLDAPFDVTTDVAWVGYANEALRAHIEPMLLATLRAHGILM